MIQTKIKVLYSCHKCGIKDRPVLIPERRFDEPITKWVGDFVPKCLYLDHLIVSPGCRIDSFSEVKIPLSPDGNSIGFVTGN